ncbi:MAG: GNAT family N-acetyltransferase [Bacteroidota bacterium]
MKTDIPIAKQAQLIQQMEANLYHLYQRIASVAGGMKESASGVRSVNVPNLLWPRTLFDRPSEETDLAQIVAKIKEGQLPPFWIMCHRDNQSLHRQLLEQGFRHMAQWPGMVLPLAKREAPVIDDSIEISQLSEEAELRAWLALVNENLMKTTHLNFSLFQKCLREIPNLRFYGLKLDGEMVSTGLTYWHKDILGIYMLSTAKAHRRRGYTTLLLAHLLAVARNNDCRYACLQASADGQWVYPKLGFETICHFDIYWLLGYR